MKRIRAARWVLWLAGLAAVPGLWSDSAWALNTCWEESESVVVNAGASASITLALHCSGTACCGVVQTFSMDPVPDGPHQFCVPYTWTLPGSCPATFSGQVCGTITGVPPAPDYGIKSAYVIRADGTREDFAVPFGAGPLFCGPGDRLFLKALACDGSTESGVWRWYIERSHLVNTFVPLHAICSTDRIQDWWDYYPQSIEECQWQSPCIITYRCLRADPEGCVGIDPTEHGYGDFSIWLIRRLPDGLYEKQGSAFHWRSVYCGMTWKGIKPARVAGLHGPRLPFSAWVYPADWNGGAQLAITNTDSIRFYHDRTSSLYHPAEELQLLNVGPGAPIVWDMAHCFGHVEGGSQQIDPVSDWIDDNRTAYRPVRFEIEPRDHGLVHFTLRSGGCRADSKLLIVKADIDWAEEEDSWSNEMAEDEHPFFVPLNDNDDNGNGQYDYQDDHSVDPDLRPIRIRIGPHGAAYQGQVEFIWGENEVGTTRTFRVWRDRERTEEIGEFNSAGMRTCRAVWDVTEFPATQTFYVEAVRAPGNRTFSDFRLIWHATYVDSDGNIAYGGDSDGITLMPVQVNISSPNVADVTEDSRAPGFAGLLLPVNDNNSDNDPADENGQGLGVDDRLDGYNHNGIADDADDFNLTPEGWFAEDDLKPVTLGVYHPLAVSAAQAHYLADSRISITTEGGQAPPGEPLNGRIRLWRCTGEEDIRPNNRLGCDPTTDETCHGDGLLDGRRAQAVPDGDWLADGTYTGRELGLGIVEGVEWTGGITLYVEGISGSQSLADAGVTVRFDAYGDDSTEWDHSDVLRMTVAAYDLDVDSDNTDGLGAPARDAAEEEIEDRVPGKIIAWNNDDDNANDTPDYQDMAESEGEGNDLVPMVVDIRPGARWRLHVLDRNASTCGQVRVWMRPTKGAGQEILPDAWQQVAGHDLTQTLYLEGTAPSKQWGDARIRLEVDSNGDGVWLPEEPSDLVRLTALEIKHEVFPDEPIEISADDHRSYVVGLLSYRDPATDEFVDAADGSVVRWEVIEGEEHGSCQGQTESYAGGTASLLTTDTVEGSTYRVRGNLVSLVLPEDFCPDCDWQEGCAVGCGIVGRSAAMEVVPGKPAEIWLDKDKDSYHSDQTDTVNLFATIFDQYGNLVEDGTSVTWELDGSTSDFAHKDIETLCGGAGACLLAPMLPFDQGITFCAGTAEATLQMDVESVTGCISGPNHVLDISLGEQASLGMIVAAVDGTPVNWLCTNGTLTGQSSVVAGQIQAVLSSASAKPGPVVIIAGIGDRNFIWQGTFIRSNGLSVVPIHPVLTSDAGADDTVQIDLGDGTLFAMPVYIATNLAISGTTDSKVWVSVPGESRAEGFTCDAGYDGVVLGDIAGHAMVLGEAILDTTQPYLGTASLMFGGQAGATVADSPELSFTSEFRVEMWIRPSVIGGTLISKGNSIKLEMLPDAKLRGTVATTDGVFVVTTTSGVPADTWSLVALQLKNGALQAQINRDVATDSSVSGTIASTNAGWTVGQDYTGHVDEIAIFSNTPGANQVLFATRDAAGGIHVNLQSIVISSMASPQMYSPLGTTILVRDSATSQYVDIMFGTKEGQEFIWRLVVLSLGADEPRDELEHVANFIVGFLPSSAIGTSIRQVWYLANGDPRGSYLQLGLSAIGSLTSVIKPLASAYRGAQGVLQARQNGKMVNVIYKALKADGSAATGTADALAPGKQLLLEALEASPQTAQSLARLRWSQDMLEWLTRAHGKFGDEILAAVGRVADAANPQTAERLIRVVGTISDGVVASLRQSANYAQTLDDLSTVVQKVPNPQQVIRILDNLSTQNSAFAPATFISTLASGNLTVANAGRVLGRVASPVPNFARGGCFEVTAASRLAAQSGRRIIACDVLMGQASVDLVDTAGTLYQCKAATYATYVSRMGEYRAWCTAAVHAAGDPSKVKWVVPDAAQVPEAFSEWLRKAGIDLIAVDFPW